MNSSCCNSSGLPVRDSFNAALAKNLIVVLLCTGINYINSSLVFTFFQSQTFRENPRYVLFIHMVLNDMIQLSIAGALHVVSYVFYTINVSLCCLLLMVAIFTTLNTPLNLAGMAVERYIAICDPLRHSQICTVRRTYTLIALIWVGGALPILPDLFVLLATEPASFFHSTILCSRDYVFRHPYLLQKKNVSHMVYLSLVWLTLTYTYFRILFAAKAASADARRARNTILLHAAQLLMCMFTYIGPLLDTLLLDIFPSHLLEIRFTSYLIVHILPRFLSPIIYGMRDQAFRKHLKHHLLCTICLSRAPRRVSVKKHSANIPST
ncbi:odorant receptor 131-2-like [Amia ocellicauda]|uniref:odorant receptor 131-2-like n=1 Tax=Amia ocellicauda TaxID=2972642 RepID=UPI00346400E6